MIKKGAIINGAPFGRKKPKKSNLCVLNAIMFIPRNKVSANENVTKIWLVIVRE